jgi:hypothetical protein
LAVQREDNRIFDRHCTTLGVQGTIGFLAQPRSGYRGGSLAIGALDGGRGAPIASRGAAAAPRSRAARSGSPCALASLASPSRESAMPHG